MESFTSLSVRMSAKGASLFKQCSAGDRYQTRFIKLKTNVMEWSKGAFSKTKTIKVSSVERIVLGRPSADVLGFFSPEELEERTIHVIVMEDGPDLQPRRSDLELIAEDADEALAFTMVLCSRIVSAAR